MTTEMCFDDITPTEIPVTVGKKHYILLEAMGDVSCKWENAKARCAKVSQDGKTVAIDGLADTTPYLLSLCLYLANPQGKIDLLADGTPDPKTLVPLKTIRSWPFKITKALYNKLVEISELNEKETVEALETRITDTQKRLESLRSGENLPKNGHSDTLAGSISVVN